MSDDIDTALRLGVKQARDAAGGPSGLAARLAELGRPVTSQAISQWRRIPAERVVDVERATGVARRELRPDLFAGEGGDAATEAGR